MRRFKAALILLVLLAGIGGCGANRPAVEFELTMYFKDGTKKVFTGQSIARNNSTGEWSYTKANGTRRYFMGEIKIRPIAKTSPRTDFEILAENPKGNK